MAAKTGTYALIDSTTLGSAQSSVTFSSISAFYTDLRLVVAGNSAGSYINTRIQFNSDTGSNYSYTTLGLSFPGNVATITTSNVSSNTFIRGAQMDNAERQSQILDIMSYSNTNTFKPVLIKTYNSDNNSSYPEPHQTYLIGLWRSTSAISSITLSTDGVSFASGSTFNLYGIEAGNL